MMKAEWHWSWHVVRSEHTIVKKQKPSLCLTPVFHEKRGVFVTLTKAGQLRGCIGFPYPVMPLGDAIEDAAVAAATGDPRFPPVRRDELPSVRVEVTILTVPCVLDAEPYRRPEMIEVGKHGLIIRARGRSGLLLPQVATEYLLGQRHLPRSYLHQGRALR